MSTNTRISFLSKIIDEDIFLDKRNQAPMAEKINKVEWNRNEIWIFVVECSATESVKGSCVVKNGLSALRYLKLGIDKKSNSSPIITKKEPIIRIEDNKINILYAPSWESNASLRAKGDEILKIFSELNIYSYPLSHISILLSFFHQGGEKFFF